MLLFTYQGGAKHLPKFGRFVNFLAFFGFLLMVAVILGATPIQNHFMPKLGYTECKVLDGGPSMWFTDWVKNPEWCVKGKSPEWVFEQAGLPGSLARQ